MIKQARGQGTYIRDLYDNLTLNVLVHWEGYWDSGRYDGPMDLCYPEESDIEWTPLAVTICNGTQVIAVLPDPTCSGSFDPSLYDDIQSYVEELFNESGERDNEEDL